MNSHKHILNDIRQQNKQKKTPQPKFGEVLTHLIFNHDF